MTNKCGRKNQKTPEIWWNQKKINILQGYYIPTKMSTRYFKYVGKEYSEWLSDREPEVGKGYPKNVRAQGQTESTVM